MEIRIKSTIILTLYIGIWNHRYNTLNFHQHLGCIFHDCQELDITPVNVLRTFLNFLNDEFRICRFGCFLAIAPVMIADLARAHDALARPILLVRVMHADEGGRGFLSSPVAMPCSEIELACILCTIFEDCSPEAVWRAFKPLAVVLPGVGELQLTQAVELGPNELPLVHAARPRYETSSISPRRHFTDVRLLAKVQMDHPHGRG